MNAPRDLQPPLTLEQRFTLEQGSVYLTGTQALVRLLLDQRRADRRAGLNTAGFVCGYPGSPVGGVDHELWRRAELLAEHQIVHRQGLNEELAATAAFGTQMLHEVPGARHDGVFAMWFGKAPGVDRSIDAFHHHNWRGVGRHGGVLAVAGDDPHARSTIFPSDSNAAFYKLAMPILAPGHVQEVLDLGLHGYALSRACGLWVGFKFVTDVADSAATAQVGPGRVRPVIPELLHDGQLFRPRLRANEAGPPLIEAERTIMNAQLELARRYAAANGLNRIVLKPEGARVGLVAGGKTWYDLRQALRDLGLDDAELQRRGIALLKIGMLYPLEPRIVADFARGLDEIVVVEDKRPWLELFIKDILYAAPDGSRPRIVGKADDSGAPLLPLHGELSPDVIARALGRRLATQLAGHAPAQARLQRLQAPARGAVLLSTTRTPYFCSGCPHNSSLKAPEGAIVGAGIGCHIMALWMPKGYGSVKGYTQMGGEGAQWVGLAPFTDTRHFFQNLGDGTFAHSGSLGVRFAAATGTHVTYKLLFNSTVAMTGGQPVQGGMSVSSMVQSLQAEGVRRIIVTTDEPQRYPGGKVGNAEVWPRERLMEAEQLLAKTEGVTVLLHDQQCATEKRRQRKRGKLAYKPRSAFINQRVCEGCGDCGVQSNCLSVQPVATEFGRKTEIHQSSCNQDLSCLKGDCPSFVTVESPAVAQRLKAPRRLPFPEGVVLPEPVAIVPQQQFAVCLTGIGGTGVVTVNQVLGTAAFSCGMRVQTYDHTGSSQKAGPVVSHLKVLAPGTDAAPTVGSGEADLLLVFDPLVGAAAHNLALAAAGRTVAVVSTTAVPTGEMVADRQRSFPAEARLRELIDGASRPEHNLFVDAQQLAERLLGDHMASNMFLVGAACQRGALPIPPAAIEEAIRLNGTAVEMNILALRWGRLYVAERERVEGALQQAAAAEMSQAVPAPAPDPVACELVARAGADGELRRLLDVRVPELIAYQDEAYAARYVERLRRLREAEAAALPGSSALAEAAARQLYKLMACKDEYEVARLLLDAGERARLEQTFGAGARLRWHLHPTFLRRLGRQRKLELGPWFGPVLKLLARAKGLRGGAFDLFARSEVRRVERALLQHYEALVDALIPRLGQGMTPEQQAQAVALLASPDDVRGYEDVKLRCVGPYLSQAQRLAAALSLAVPLPQVLQALAAGDSAEGT